MLILVIKLVILYLLLFPVIVFANSYLFNAPTDPLLARQSSVYHISQDKDGFIWFGSDTDGLLRFDGKHSINWLNLSVASNNRININTFIFTEDNDLWISSWRDGLRYHPKNKPPYIFAVNEQLPDALASERVQTLFKDSKGRMWAGSIAGLHYIDLKAPYTLHRIAFAEPEHPLYQQRIWGITESAEGLWIATSQGIVLLDLELKTTQRFYLPLTSATDSARAKEVRDVEFINQTVWAASANGVFYYQHDCQCFTKLNTPNSFTDPRVNTIHAGNANRIWVGAADGLYQFDSNNLDWLKAGTHYNFLPDVDVRSIFLDKDQQLWVGSREQGVFVGHQQYQSFELLSAQLPQDLVEDAGGLTNAIYHDTAGSLWLASQDKLLYRDADKVSWQDIEIRQQFGIRKVYRIAEDPAGDIWLATDVGLFRIDNFSLTAVTTPFQLAKRPVSAITELAISASGNFYLGLWQHGLIFWQPDLAVARLELTELSKTSGDQIYHINQGDDGTLFAVSRYSGLFVKDATNNNWSPYPLTKQKLVDGYNCVLPEADTILWLCSEFGLWRFNRVNREITQYSIAHGLPSMFISGAFFDNEQRFWALTNHGPARFEPKLQRFVSYSKYDGLPDLSMQRNSFSISPGGEILLGTAKGTAVMQVKPELESLKSPTLVISKLIINGVDYSREYQQGSGQIELPYSYRELIIGYSLLDYRNPEMNTTRSRLLGLSNLWTPYDTNHEVRYVNLPPGKYTLEVEGQNARGIGTAQALILKIIVKTPWWTATWLWLSIIVILFFAAVGFMQLKQLNLNKRNKRLQQLVSERTSELEALTIKLKKRAEHDPLTGLLNRAGFTDRFKDLLQSCSRQNQALTLVLIDLDNFKQLNDIHGHNAGDKVLQHFSNLLRSRLRVSDAAGRWGGEEFIIALGNCQEAGAKAFCEQLLISLQQTPCVYNQMSLPYTATFGVVSLPITTASLDTWIKLADEALYQGKALGRAQVVISKAKI